MLILWKFILGAVRAGKVPLVNNVSPFPDVPTGAANSIGPSVNTSPSRVNASPDGVGCSAQSVSREKISLRQIVDLLY